MNAFAQTDLDQRVHRNQPTRDLGKMSFGILQTFLSRLKSLGIVGSIPELNTILRQFQVKDNEFDTIEYSIIEDERPPMNSIPEYKNRKSSGFD
jgi:glucosyl-3-phosphoglycerate synthase